MSLLISELFSPPAFLPSLSTSNTSVTLPKSWGMNLEIVCNSIKHPQPLEWQSWEGKELVNTGGFLDAPGLPIFNLLSEADLALLPCQLTALLEKVDWLAYELLQAALASQAAYELAVGAPMLFIFLVLECQKHKVTKEDFKQLVLLPRKLLAKFCNLPASKGLVKLLNNLRVISKVQEYQLNGFIFLLNKPKYLKLLSHVKQPSTNHLQFLTNYTGYIWPNIFNLVEEGGRGSKFFHMRSLIEDCRRLGATPTHFRQITSYDELNQLHNRLITEYNAANRNRWGRAERIADYLAKFGDYPQAPIAGNKNILPLTSWEALVDEGLEMHHCVGSYGGSVATGKVFIYKVLYPQRLTLAIEIRGKFWQVKEVRGYCNQKAIEDAVADIKAWLEPVKEVTPEQLANTKDYEVFDVAYFL